MKSTRLLNAASTLVLGLLLLPLVAASGDDEHKHGHEHGGAMEGAEEPVEYPPTYFSHLEHVGVMYGHILLMTLAWVFVLPIAVMFSLVKSRYTLTTQFVFLAFNGLGILLATIYNVSTPDLYPNNVHHKIGWVITWAVSAHVLVSLVGYVSGVVSGENQRSDAREHAFMPVPTSARYSFALPRRSSAEDTEPESLRSNSVSTLAESESALENLHKDYEDDEFEELHLTTVAQKGRLALHAAKVVSSRVWRVVEIAYKVGDRIILPFGFIAFTTGIVTYGRFFEGNRIFGGLAHWVKGGVFFWLGLFTLGRWAGSFAELGWAWNVRPKTHNKWRPSAEFVESALIAFYGATNIFLEHLGSTDGKWVPQDLEHISITVLFLGGGLCGMLVESTWIRDLLNTPVSNVVQEAAPVDEEREELQPPQTYEFSINPIPALVILLLGIMMSSHHQHTAISAMVHKQWGTLFLWASFARAVTYVTMYLKPPKSVYPSRPPTELLSAFGLIAGGIIFMASSKDTVEGMVHYHLEEMSMYTVSLGFVGLLMAWELLVLALKGWALQKEKRSGRCK